MIDDLQVRLNLDNAPDIAAELGNMCAAWAALEYRMFVVFRIISDTPTAMARAIFYSLHATRNRTDLVRKVAAMIFRGNELAELELESLDDLCDRIDKTGTKRNKYIHDPWIADPSDEHAAAQMRLGGRDIHGEGIRVKKKDLTQLIAQIQKWTEELFAWQKRVDPMLSTLLGRLDHTRSVTLAFPNQLVRAKRPKGHPRQLRPSRD